MNLTDFGFIMRNRIAYGINAVSQRLIEKLQNEKLDKIIVEATTSVMDYLVSPYTMLSALPFGDSSLRLGDGSIFVHKDQMIESTMMVIYQNGLKTYTLAVDENTAEVTSITDQGNWMLSQVGLSVNDIYNPSYWVGTNPSLKSTLNALNTSLTNINGLIIRDRYDKTVTVGANAITTVNMGAYKGHTGYRFIGFTTYSNGFADQWLVSYSIYGQNVQAMIRSKYASSLTSVISCFALHVKDGYVQEL